MSNRVLIVDDEQAMCELIAAGLVRRGLEVEWQLSAEEALARVQAADFQTVVTDLNMAKMNGLEFCQRVLELRPGLPVIVLTAFGSLETAVEAIRVGAYDFITKPLDVEVLGLAVDRAIQTAELRDEVARLRRTVALGTSFGELVGTSAAMKKLYALLHQVAGTDASLLITGETGTGKELVARSIHASSDRAEGRFVAVNCAAMPSSLLESEFFGHVKGAFTDARSAHEGIFEQAGGGTVFLDEIGELPLELQPKLLRALQEHKVRPVGASGEVEFDARIIAATNRDLETAVEEGTFREDLLYRLDVIRVDVPPLRVRGNDILLLAQRFLEFFATRSGVEVGGLSEPVAQLLLRYPWPGNVRELENCMERAVALANHELILADALPEKIRDHRRSRYVLSAEDPEDFVPLHEVERRYILRVFEAYGGNKRQAAIALGLDRKTLWRKLKEYGVDKPGTR